MNGKSIINHLDDWRILFLLRLGSIDGINTFLLQSNGLLVDD